MARRVFDAHADVLNDVAWRRAAGERRVLATRHLPNLRAGGVAALVAAIYVEPIFKPHGALPRALHILGAALDDLAEAPEAFRLVREGADFDRAADAGQIAIVLGLEGAEPVETGPEALRVFYEAGVRSLGLTWNQRNLLADGAADVATGGGLSVMGEQVVRAANRLGVVVDVSHLSPAGVDHVLRVSDAPIAATHTNAAALRPHRRNLDDARLCAIAAGGGVVGAVAVGAFLAETEPTVDHFLDHVDYLIRLVGERHVGLGLDFVEYVYTGDLPILELLFTGGSPGERVRGLTTWTDLPALLDGLTARGHGVRLPAVAYDNFVRLYRDVLG